MGKGIIASLLLLCLSNEVISLAVLCVWGFIAVAWLMRVAAEGGAFD